MYKDSDLKLEVLEKSIDIVNYYYETSRRVLNIDDYLSKVDGVYKEFMKYFDKGEF